MKKDYKLIQDPVYGYKRIDPIPSKEEVDRYYREEFYSKYKNFNDSALEVQTAESDFFRSRWEAIYSRCMTYFKGNINDKSLFDIGFGYAQALLFFKEKGLRVSGLEPSPEGVAYAKAHGLQVYDGEIEDLPTLDSKRFDIVTIINVLEHLRFPAQTLLKTREKLLTPQGLLIIDIANEFNDFQVAANTEYNLGEWWVCPPNHINYFSITSACRLLEQCGYQIVHKEASFPLELFLLMGDIYVGNEKMGKTCHQKRVRFEHVLRMHGKEDKLNLFYEALAKLDLGRQGLIYAKPIQ